MRVPRGGLPAAALAVVLGVGLLASACQWQDGGGGRGVPSGQEPAESAPGGDGRVTPGTAPPTATAQGPVRLRGTLRAGVEPGCLLLDAEQGGSYLLLGEQRPRLPEGAEVEVSGVLERIRTTCQQGTPLRVVSARER